MVSKRDKSVRKLYEELTKSSLSFAEQLLQESTPGDTKRKADILLGMFHITGDIKIVEAMVKVAKVESKPPTRDGTVSKLKTLASSNSEVATYLKNSLRNKQDVELVKLIFSK